jgi:hypothetical protein
MVFVAKPDERAQVPTTFSRRVSQPGRRRLEALLGVGAGLAFVILVVLCIVFICTSGPGGSLSAPGLIGQGNSIEALVDRLEAAAAKAGEVETNLRGRVHTAKFLGELDNWKGQPVHGSFRPISRIDNLVYGQLTRFRYQVFATAKDAGDPVLLEIIKKDPSRVEFQGVFVGADHRGEHIIFTINNCQYTIVK